MLNNIGQQNSTFSFHFRTGNCWFLWKMMRWFQNWKRFFCITSTFFLISKIQISCTKNVHFIKFGEAKVSNQDSVGPSHTEPCTWQFECQLTWKRRIYIKLQHQICQELGKFTLILKFATRSFFHKILPQYPNASNMASKTSLTSSPRNPIAIYRKSILMPTHRPKCYPYPLIIKFSHFCHKAMFFCWYVWNYSSKCLGK